MRKHTSNSSGSSGQPTGSRGQRQNHLNGAFLRAAHSRAATRSRPLKMTFRMQSADPVERMEMVMACLANVLGKSE
ncbi:hypothetical protein FHS21_005656 [Phyllobacterium trifolii]|uniref:Uncharacterized protein n=1 Tax=Phyllobacterium trifolii TaxID=300193 RepID=A0A839UHB3_9HYPH|nr:hypothetical protein [Phyllobacterium trifolii]MBB3149204.1 hypothetical protein [Phyllobacterium trifolii]